MIDRLRIKLTYANVVATIALFISLGGTTYAALELTGRDIRDGSLTGRDIRRDSLGGARIKESRLAPVPRARNAARLAGVPISRLLIKCPRDTVAVSDTCVERTPRSAAPTARRLVTVRSEDRRTTPGRRLPSHDELMTALGDEGIALAPGR